MINLHWSSANVNFIADDCAKNVNTCVVDSKDAKSIVPGDIAPVQKPMKTWKQRSGILPDHDWEQGRANAVTPMAHLFLETKSIVDTEQVFIPLTGSAAGVLVTRTGQAVNLIYLSHYEPETVLRCFNKLFFLLAQPSLDRFFRNPDTGQLKENFVFIGYYNLFVFITQVLIIEQKADQKNGESEKEKAVGDSTDDGVLSMDSSASSASILQEGAKVRERKFYALLFELLI